ncbi:lipopolysaccharide-induced tumor necrosis factor-alpha factor homolog [Tigriopus californicus]|uniref:lipopolysaccharide-induced tumor necrosis factor-alpha factor homolog n=1 Tax=Tigriopus californicus TaxID=6832 RepID=UPI0027DAA8B6|nr:lipopolysaccharide-induced tumor necrosis factor-alpha factor homolog [Tigriopus californicus]
MSYANGGGSNGYSTPKGAPIPAHDLSGQSQFSNGYTYGANPPPGWSQYVGPDHKAPPPVATQLVVPSELSDTQVTLTCYNCQQHVTTTTKTGPSPWTWAWCCCLCTFVCWPCCLLPFCYSKLNITEHYCPNCNIKLGKYKAWKK